MNHELTPSHTDTEATIVKAVTSMRQLLRDENGRRLVEPHDIASESGTVTLGYEDASFEWAHPRLLIDVRVEGSNARGIYIVDCRSKAYEKIPQLHVSKFDQQLGSVRDANDLELDDIARLVSSVNDDYVDRVFEQRRAESKRSSLGSKLSALFSRKRST